MRVSTSQFYFQNSQRLTTLQSDVNEQVQYLSSGKRVLTAKDDAVSYSTLSGYKNEQTNIEKYQRNINQAESHNALQEVSFSTAEDIMLELKQTFTQANNGSLSTSDLEALADLAKGSQSSLIDTGNKQDANGNYIFSGYQTSTEPFSLQPDNSVVYLGDNGVRELQISKNIFVETNQTGHQAFEKVPNDLGDFSTSYSVNASGISVNSAIIAQPGSYDDVGFPPDYTFNFTSATDLTVTDGSGTPVYSTTTYAPGQTVAFNGVEVVVSGNPLPGDSFSITPEEHISIFETVQSAIDWMNQGNNPVNPLQHQVDHAEILSQIDQALNHMTAGRVNAGVRLNLIDVQSSNHLDSELHIASGQSNIEDIDFAKAVTAFEQSQVTLQAAQQSFVQIKNLSLFNYI